MYIDIHTHNRLHSENSGGKDFYSLGIHPCEGTENWAEEERDLEEYAVYNRVIAIGEAGLDKLCETDFNLQKEIFIYQIRLSELIKKPLIIHCVRAFDELIALKKELKPQQAWIIHGFRGKPEQMKQLLRHDLYFSFGLYFNEETVRQIPLDRLFLETDDSKTYIQDVYRKVAECRSLNEIELIRSIEKNFVKIFLNRTFVSQYKK
ncbi:TatD family hydrolase [Bacteroidia bacterium]|nr:TatD family hydrolase [Bacteroidia bacterium]